MKSDNYQTNYRLKVLFSWLGRGNQGFRLSLIVLIATLPSYIALQAQPTLAQEAIAQSPTLNKNIIYVDPQQGDDSQVGKKTSPLKTITQALKLANAGSTIQLASGTYSEETGEKFPLVIQNQITLQGNSENQGYNTIIQGNGYFISPTGAGQYVAIAAVEDAGGMIGVTVINNHARGHGLWIETANPKIVSNTFTRNGNTGVSVNGNSSPIVEDNYFYNNSGNGLIVYGTSQPKVIDNTFKNTGFGVSVVENAAPTLTKNTFDGNRIGIILEGNSQAVLRDNEIINSQESGLTAIAQSQVDLGTTNEVGNNIFRSNRKLDIQNATSNQIPAVGTEAQGEIIGDINFDSGTFVATNDLNDDSSFRDLPPLPSRRNLDNPPIPRLNLPTPTTPSEETSETLSEETSDLPAPPPVPASDTSSNKELVFNSSSSTSTAVPDVEPVPSVPEISSLSSVLSPTANPVKYKVLVETLSGDEENEVRSLYPEAFKTIFQGKSWLQIGAFNQWDKAKQAEQTLVNLGLATYLLE